MNKLTSEDRERIIEAVLQHKSSEGWIYIKKALTEWKESEQRRLKKYEITGIKESDVSDYNRCIDRIDGIDRFLNIHDTVISFNRGLLDKMTDYLAEKYGAAESFVKEII